MNIHNEFKSTDEKAGRRVILGILAGGVLFIVFMLIVVAVLISLELITSDILQSHNLTMWLMVEIIFGTLFSLISGRVCRKIAGQFKGPLFLALIIFLLGLLETSEIIRFVKNNNYDVSFWFILAAPFAASAGILIGGYRRSEDKKVIAVTRFKIFSFWRYTIPVFILITAALIAIFGLDHNNHSYKTHVVASALAFDMVVVVPSLVYFLLVRVKKIPWIAIVPSIVIGYTIVLVTFPDNQKHLLDFIRLSIIPAEIIFISYLVIKTRKLFSLISEANEDFVSRLRSTAHKLLGNRISADIIATEIGILYHVFRKNSKLKNDVSYFTVHKKSGYASVLTGLFIVLFVETIAIHFLLSQWSTATTWIVTGLSVYAMIWFIGDYRAFSARPIFFTNTYLILRVGLRWEAKIPLNLISEAGIISNKSTSEDVLKIKILGEPNIRLKFKRPIQIIGMYGIRKTSSELLMQVDNNLEFCVELNKYVL